jgi:4-hydroxybenzoate polyprenyltransferase
MNVFRTVATPIRQYLSLVRFSHTVFALPFALMAYLVAVDGRIPWGNLVLVIFAMITARTAAMTFNRIVDRKFDALNPRTRFRELVSGEVSVRQAALLLAAASLSFLVVTWFINRLAFLLAPVALTILFAYSFTKRFTSFTHFFLGLALGIAPVGAWIAATGRLETLPLVLGTGVICWVAGFDIIYACQDYRHDLDTGLHSLVVRLGPRRALHLSSLLHAAAVLLFVVFGVLGNLGLVYFTGLVVVAGSFIYQHSIVSPGNLSRVNIAFFTLNGFVSVSLFAFTAVDLYI